MGKVLAFRWKAAGPIPHACDLRRLGWRLIEGPVEDPLPVLARREGLALAEWMPLAGGPPGERARTAMLQVGDPQERARLLRMGFGEALGPEATLGEIEARVLRLGAAAHNLPRHRRAGPVLLDLLARDAIVAGRPAGLHPREFALLWRLADQPGVAASAPELLRDVWRLSFRPETNSLAVHVSRLRAKLRVAGVDGLVETLPDGSYRMAIPGAAPLVASSTDHLALDAYLRLGEEPRNSAVPHQQDEDHVA